MSYASAAQQAIFDALDGEISATVFDAAPFLPEGAPSTTFPYVVIGDDTFSPWDTDDSTGANVTVTLHIWTRAESHKPGKAIADAIYAILHRQQLTLTGYDFTDCQLQFSDFMRDPDGATRHGVLRYRLTFTTA